MGILEGRFHEGDIIEVAVGGGELVLRTRHPERAAAEEIIDAEVVEGVTMDGAPRYRLRSLGRDGGVRCEGGLVAV